MKKSLTSILACTCIGFSLLVQEVLLAGPQEYVSAEMVDKLCVQLYDKIQQDNFTPDLIVGLSRGGLVPLGYLAGDRAFDIRTTLSISVKSYEKDHQSELQLLLPFHKEDIQHCKSILIVDDLVDSGKTLGFIINLFKESLPQATIKTAALFYKPLRSSIKPDYYVEATDNWIVFPWE